MPPGGGRVLTTTTDAAGTGQIDQAAPAPSRSRWGTRLLLIAVVAFVSSPLIVAQLQTVGVSWTPLGDWAHMVYRTSQVFSGNIPLVGAYTTKGWAHPGPLDFWLSAPLFELTGGDPRALLWTAGIINIASIAGLGAVAWRRGRWPWFLSVMALTAALVHGFGPNYLSDIWNPFVPLLPFTLAVFLLYDAATGRKRALIGATVAASFAMQSHLAFVILDRAAARMGRGLGVLLAQGRAGRRRRRGRSAGPGRRRRRTTPTDVGGLEATDPPQRRRRSRAVDRTDLRRAVRSPQPAEHRPLVRVDRRALRLPLGPRPGRPLRASRRSVGGRRGARRGT